MAKLPPPCDTMKTDASGLVMPWLTHPALDVLEQIIKPSHSVLEWGSGYSTVWFASRAYYTLSVDHDAECQADVKAKIGKLNDRVVLKHFDIGALTEYDGNPWSPYAIATHPAIQGGYEIILVDGMCRVGCFIRALALLARGGFIIVDNHDRELSQPIQRIAEICGLEFKHFDQPNREGQDPWRTTIFRRPA